MATPPPGRKRKRYVIAATLTLAIGLVLTLAGLFTLTRLEPAHWKAHRAFIAHTTVAQRQELADQAREKFRAVAQRTRQATPSEHTTPRAFASVPTDPAVPVSEAKARDDPRDTITFTHEQINALLNEELAHQVRRAGYNMPPEITDPMIDYVNGRYVMAFAYRSARYSQVISAYFDLQFMSDGTAVVRMDTFDAGQLPVPADQMNTYLAQQVGSERARQIGQWLVKLKHFEFDPVMKLDDGQQVRVENITITDAGYILSVRVLDRNHHRPIQRQRAPA